MGGNIMYAVVVQDSAGGPLRDTGVSRTRKAQARGLAYEALYSGAVCAVLRTNAGTIVETIPGPRAQLVPAPADRPWFAASTVPRTIGVRSPGAVARMIARVRGAR